MRQLLLLLLLLIGVAVLQSCNSSADKENRSPGEISFRSNCQTCHVLPKPSMKSDDQWPEIVAKYGTKAKLSQLDQNKITSYLISQN